MWNRKVFVRIIEVLLCVACVVALRVTDDESRRVFHYLRNRSLDWALLNNVTWGSVGAALASATCAGYFIITVGLLIAAARNELRGRAMEIFLLGLGVILFGVVGSLAMASIDSVPSDLIDNAAVLGALCLVTALVFIADMLMGLPNGKKKHDGTQTMSSKEQGKQYVTTTTMTINEKDGPPAPTKTVTTSWRSPPTPEMKEKRNSMNDSLTEDDRDERDHRLDRAERQMREYAQNIENGRGGRNKQHGRDEMPRKANGYYRGDDVYQRPVDEVDDAPPFPTNGDTPVFTKVLHPGVKIMRVERDDDRGAYDNYRYSDSSQYDNVPTRMRNSSSPGILKKQRDVSFADPRRSRGYRHQTSHPHAPPLDLDQLRRPPHQASNTRDEIEILEECFDALRTSTMTTSTGPVTQTTTGADKSAPTSPNDPGFVRHTASNWPQIIRSTAAAAATDEDSPERDRNR